MNGKTCLKRGLRKGLPLTIKRTGVSYDKVSLAGTRSSLSSQFSG